MASRNAHSGQITQTCNAAGLIAGRSRWRRLFALPAPAWPFFGYGCPPGVCLYGCPYLWLSVSFLGFNLRECIRE